MKLPDWLAPLGARDEKLRAAHGLTPKRDGWHKSIDGHTRYVAKPMPVRDVMAILPDKVAQIRARLKGRTVPVPVKVVPGTLTLHALSSTYLSWLYQRHTTGLPKKLARRTYDDNVRVIGDFVALAGPNKQADAVGPDDFAAYSRKYFAKRAATSIRREIIYIEAFANWAAPGTRKAGLISRPWFFGPDFRKPTDAEMAEAAGDTDKAYSPAELRGAFLRVKKLPTFRAAGWLGLNGAFLARDVATLPESLLDLDGGTIRFPRGKTGVARLCVLWRPTVLALRHYLDVRPEKCEEAAKGLVFRTKNGLPYARHDHAKGDSAADEATAFDGIGNRWHKLTGLPFSGLRSSFATAADDWEDQRAVDLVLGHKTDRSGRKVRSRHYAKRVEVERISRLVNHVRPLLFGRPAVRPAPQTSPLLSQAPNPDGRPSATAGNDRPAAP